jgi:hypothetical protein
MIVLLNFSLSTALGGGESYLLIQTEVFAKE